MNALDTIFTGGHRERVKMELDMWAVSPASNPVNELFNVVITARGGTQLIAQCTAREVAEHIVAIHNSAAELFIASEHPKSDAA